MNTVRAKINTLAPASGVPHTHTGGGGVTQDGGGPRLQVLHGGGGGRLRLREVGAQLLRLCLQGCGPGGLLVCVRLLGLQLRLRDGAPGVGRGAGPGVPRPCPQGSETLNVQSGR